MQVLFRLSSLLPLIALHAIGWVMGWLTFLVSPGYRREFLTNARLAGIGRAACWRAVGESGKLVAELPRVWLGRLPAVRWVGADVIDRALAAGQGVLFLTPHLGCFEMTALAYAAEYGQRGHPMTILFRSPRKVWLQSLVVAARQRPGLETATTTTTGVRQLLRALKRGGCVGMLPDQVPPRDFGVWAPFFGKSAYTMTLSARLVQQTGATVVLAWGERLSWGRGYVIRVESLAQPLATEPVAAATQINAAMETLIQHQPDQYLWGYARYKSPRDSF